MHRLLQLTAHRPWPLPSGPWVMKQTWHDLLFAHWPVPEEVMREQVPEKLTLDLFNGQCWIGMVPFRMSGIRGRAMPPFPVVSRFPELNVRTYVTHGGKPGVYFFSLDAASLAAVWAARAIYHLPYFHAAMVCEERDGRIHYSSRRHDAPAEFRASYRPIAEVRHRAQGSIEHWLAERYSLYTVHRDRVFRGDIHHQMWPLQDAEAEIEMNTMGDAAGIAVQGVPPSLLFARRLEVLIWPLRPAD